MQKNNGSRLKEKIEIGVKSVDKRKKVWYNQFKYRRFRNEWLTRENKKRFNDGKKPK